MSRAALIPFALLALSCSRFAGNAEAEEPEKAAPAPSAAPAAKPAESHDKDQPEATERGTRYGVPFAWELSKDEPLSKARSYLGEVLTDNSMNAGLGKEHFAPFADKQTPRATVVTCSDSRVQSSAWDATPENDAFTIRNIGNQVTNAHGSVEYGLEHLHTPVLLILGHTGCGAVKAAMGKLDELDAPIQAELKGLKVPATDPKAPERKAWADAVVANVNNQVDFAVTHFGKLLREQKVMVVGAVYDFRNNLGHGYGRVSVVNVNGNTEPKRLRAFEAALGTAPKDGPSEPLPGLPRGPTGESPLQGLLKDQAAAALRGAPESKSPEGKAPEAKAPKAHAEAHGAPGHAAHE